MNCCSRSQSFTVAAQSCLFTSSLFSLRPADIIVIGEGHCIMPEANIQRVGNSCRMRSKSFPRTAVAVFNLLELRRKQYSNFILSGGLKLFRHREIDFRAHQHLQNALFRPFDQSEILIQIPRQNQAHNHGIIRGQSCVVSAKQKRNPHAGECCAYGQRTSSFGARWMIAFHLAIQLTEIISHYSPAHAYVMEL